MILNRSCIYPKDVQRITGKSERTRRRLLQKIKNELGKQEHQFVTVEEFAQYSGISAEVVQKYVTDWIPFEAGQIESKKMQKSNIF